MLEPTLRETTQTINDIVAAITGEVTRLADDAAFNRWRGAQTFSSEGLVVINNSFVFRDVNTSKAGDYLALTVGENGGLGSPPVIASGLRINLDFKYLSPTSSLPVTRTLAAAVRDGLARLGELLFILIGEIDDNRILSEVLNHDEFDDVLWTPALGDVIVVDGRRLNVGQVHDEDALWNGVHEHYRTLGQPVPDGLRDAVGVALDKLQQNAVADVQIPRPGQSAQRGITDSIVAVLKGQMAEYHAALARLVASPADAVSQNEILRLAYNFASDATGYLRLIVSICDLKPLVLWGTISHHVALSEAFRELPWTRSRNKPSLKNYIDTISDARNSAFHNLFPFRKSLNVRLTRDALAEPELVIFSEHGKKKDNALSYRDKPLVDVLTEFTRARERRVTTRFWQQNEEVMARTIALFEATSAFVRLLHRVR